jgi:hypothetical protein
MDVFEPKNVDKVDSWLAKVGNLLKKRWWVILTLIVLYGGYKFCVLVGKEIDNPTIEKVKEDTVYIDRVINPNDSTNISQ